MTKKLITGFMLAAVVIGLIYMFNNSSEMQSGLNGTINQSGTQTAIPDADAVKVDIENMSLEQRRSFYRSISINKPYVPIEDVLEILDQGLVDDDLSIRLSAIERFVKSYYKYGADEPGELFNKDKVRKQIFINMLNSSESGIRDGAFRILAENYNQQEDVVEVLAKTAREEKDKRLSMMRNLAHAMNSYPEIASQVYIDEVKMSGAALDKATPVDSAYILSTSANPPAEILESVITMLEATHFGDPVLLSVVENYGPLVNPYIGRLKELQNKVNERILYSRDDHGKGSSTFSKEQYARVLQKIEQSN